MRNTGKTNLILDFMMFLTMLALFCIKGELHEMLGFTIGILFIMHIGLHWKQIKVLCRQF